jgi:predicted nucleotidyltransferase
MRTDQGTSPREGLREHRSDVLAFLAERGVRDVRVFGSLARGDEDAQSDIDLLVELPDAGSAGAELMTALGLSEELSCSAKLLPFDEQVVDVPANAGPVEADGVWRHRLKGAGIDDRSGRRRCRRPPRRAAREHEHEHDWW